MVIATQDEPAEVTTTLLGCPMLWVRTVAGESGSDLGTPGAAVARRDRLGARQRGLGIDPGQPLEHLGEASSEPVKQTNFVFLNFLVAPPFLPADARFLFDFKEFKCEPQLWYTEIKKVESNYKFTIMIAIYSKMRSR